MKRARGRRETRFDRRAIPLGYHARGPVVSATVGGKRLIIAPGNTWGTYGYAEGEYRRTTIGPHGEPITEEESA